MTAKRELSHEDSTKDAITDALVDRGTDGMTVLELRAYVDADINDIESNLTDLKNENLIEVTNEDGATRIKPEDKLIPDEDEHWSGDSLLGRLREYFPL